MRYTYQQPFFLVAVHIDYLILENTSYAHWFFRLNWCPAYFDIFEHFLVVTIFIEESDFRHFHRGLDHGRVSNWLEDLNNTESILHVNAD